MSSAEYIDLLTRLKKALVISHSVAQRALGVTLYAAASWLPTLAIAAPPKIELPLRLAVPIEGVREPSGLAFDKAGLCLVSDDDSEHIYSLHIEKSVAVARPLVKLQNEAGAEGLDLEGIAWDGKNYHLLSESRTSVRVYCLDGRFLSEQPVCRLPGDGLFVTPGAGPEGLALLTDGAPIVAAEREPAGLIIGRASIRIRMLENDPSYPTKPPRPPDLTGLWVEGERLYCLARGAEAIACIDLGQPSLPVTQWLDFSHHIARFGYVPDKFGTAEGLAADEEHFYVVTDNGWKHRKGDDSDRRPTLLVLERPRSGSADAGVSAGKPSSDALRQ